MIRTPLVPMLLLVAGCLLVQRAGAADLYLSGTLGNSAANGSVSGETDFFDIEGDDADSSPAYGGSLGLAFAIDEAVPQIKGFEMPSWILRTEIDFQMGRDYELFSHGAQPEDFFSQVDAWSLMPSVWLDVPLRTPISWLFGRVPVLEPMSLYAGGGIGAASVDLETTDNVSAGEESSINFAWQAGVGLDYQLTDTTTFSLGWRYVSMGETEADLMFGPGAKAGTLALDLTSHEFVTGLRLNFYTSPLADMHPRHWRAPRVPLPELPSWLGGGDDEERPEDIDDI